MKRSLVATNVASLARAFAVLALATCLAIVAAAAIGSVALPYTVVLGVALHPHVHSEASTLLWDLRFPRIAIAALVGAALAVAGALLQGMLRNPLVDPYLTGASAGAALAVALAVALGVAAPLYGLCAFLAALATAGCVTALAKTGSGISPERLILAGVSLSALFAGVVTLILMLSAASTTTMTILGWLGGSLAGRGWSDFAWAAPYAVLGFAGALALAPAMNALRLGDLRARALGINLDRAQWAIVASASLLTAAAVSVSGIVGFVGMFAPHVARRAVGSDARVMFPAAALIGACSVVVADTVARSVAAPLELPVGVLLSLFGVPAFVYLAFARKVSLK